MMTVFKKKLEQCIESLKNELDKIHSKVELEECRKKYTSSKSIFSSLTDEFKSLSLDEKKKIGGSLQEAKNHASELLEQKKKTIEYLLHGPLEITNFNPLLSKETSEKYGSLHRYTLCIEKMEDILISLGFEPTSGPVLEEEFYNFSALNIPKDHPARDSHDTFWIKGKNKLLRTHTSSVQIREAQKKTPPFSIFSIDRVYRNEATDASHDYMFWQCELMHVSQNASLAQLLYTIKQFLQLFFEKEELSIRTRPSYFPFVEPGIEVDMTCPFCTHGCSTCKRTGWIELGGAGMIHPHVLNEVYIDNEKFSGFAFGFGVTRLVMLKCGIPDIRTLHSHE